MILELATIDIQKGKNAEFEANLAQAKKVISQSKGFQRIDIQHCIEIENRYVLFIYWENLEDHTEGFRNSELFTQWRTLIGPFFETPPVVQHFNQLDL
jgi:heme-degrading monooxygenase HmoA